MGSTKRQYLLSIPLAERMHEFRVKETYRSADCSYCGEYAHAQNKLNYRDEA
jgi:hypothetical protein